MGEARLPEIKAELEKRIASVVILLPVESRRAKCFGTVSKLGAAHYE
jgi:hypothetical protein